MDRGREPRVIRSLCMGEGELEGRNIALQKKYTRMKSREVRFEDYFTDDAEIILVAFGIAARIALASVKRLRREGLKVGLFRPITLFPFPEKELFLLAGERRRFISIEMNTGQMIEDIRLAINGRSEVLFYGKPGGSILTPEEVQKNIKKLIDCQPHLAKTDFAV